MIPDDAVEAAFMALAVKHDHRGDGPHDPHGVEIWNRIIADVRLTLEAAAPHLMAAILALCDEADNRRGSSMYCKLTTYEIRTALGVKE